MAERRTPAPTRVTALMYHDIVESGGEDRSGFPGADAALYKLDATTFGRHLDAIARWAPAEPTTIAALDRCPRQTGPLLTFDDGGAGARAAADALEGRGWRGHFFVTAGVVGSRGFLTAREVRDLRARGHLVGSHSYSHPLRMARCGSACLLDEWRRSVAMLEDVLGEPVLTASIPGGAYSIAVGRAAARAGIAVLFSSEPIVKTQLIDGTLLIGRFAIQRWHDATHVAALVRGDRRRRLEQWAFWNAKKLTKAVGGEFYLRVRELILRRTAAGIHGNS